VFEAALERPPEELEGWLDEACAGNEALKAEVEGLLRSDGEAGSFVRTEVGSRPQSPIRVDLSCDPASASMRSKGR